ncbi:ubiquinol oxidase subunit [Caudoviricetes sp.]|nr:ubiquinol oxidase subunit [Caudoviricetes sp.]
MAGITAFAASNSLPSGNTSADKTSSNWVAGERITLATSPTGSVYSWAIAPPSASSRARSALSAGSGASVTFTPDVGGTYLITCDVDGTQYALRLTVQAAAVAEPVEAVRFSPRSDASIPAPAAGLTMYYSSDRNTLCVKASDDSVSTVDLTAVS